MSESNYKMYITAMSAVVKEIDPNIKDTTITGWMSDISEVFPYYKHTNPQVMAIAKYLVQQQVGIVKFDKKTAAELVQRVSFNYVGSKDKKVVLVDVLRYWKKLSTPLDR
jgi:hypothetical protein